MDHENEFPAPETTFRMVGDMAPLFTALAQARPGFGPIVKSKTANIRPRDKPAYSYDYAPLEALLDAVAPALADAGLVLLQPLSRPGEYWELRTILAHSSGAYIECLVPFRAEGGKPQDVGTATTYIRRYSVQALLAVNSEEDNDAGDSAGEAQTAPRRQPPPAPQRNGRQPAKPAQKPAAPAEPPPERQHTIPEADRKPPGGFKAGPAKAAEPPPREAKAGDTIPMAQPELPQASAQELGRPLTAAEAADLHSPPAEPEPPEPEDTAAEEPAEQHWTPEEDDGPITDGQVQSLKALLATLGWSKSRFGAWAASEVMPAGVSPKNMTGGQAKLCIRKMQALVDKQGAARAHEAS